MNYFKAESLLEARKTGQLVITGLQEQSSVEAPTRHFLTVSHAGLWRSVRPGSPLAGWTKDDFYAFREKKSYAELSILLDKHLKSVGKPQLNLPVTGKIPLGKFFDLAVVCLKLNLLPLRTKKTRPKKAEERYLTAASRDRVARAYRIATQGF